MAFNEKTFLSHFKSCLDTTKNLQIDGKTSNQVDTVRVFKAVDCCCNYQTAFFPKNGRSYWNGKDEVNGGEFLCDYTYHNEDHKVLLALESEWGTRNSAKSTVEKVIDDFKKIINMAAPVKVMVFAYTSSSNEQECLEAMQDITRKWPQSDFDSLIAISCTWNDEMNGDTINGYTWRNKGWCDI